MVDDEDFEIAKAILLLRLFSRKNEPYGRNCVVKVHSLSEGP
jgi:hypothetical protein